MSWDEKLFRASLGVLDRLRGVRRPPAPEELNLARLSDHDSRLKLVASALANRLVEVKEAEAVGGLVADTLWLPGKLAVSPEKELNEAAYLYRVAYSLTLVQLGFVLPDSLADDEPTRVLMSIFAVPSVRKALAERFPGVVSLERELYETELKRRQPTALGTFFESQAFEALQGKAPVRDPTEAVQEAMRLSGTEGAARGFSSFAFPKIWSMVYPASAQKLSPASPGDEAPTAESLSTGTERKGKPREKVEEVKLKKDREDENPLVHAFEKVRTADDYIGGRKMTDGSDELEDQLEALQELDFRKIIRTRDRAESVYKVDAMIEASVGDLLDEDSKALPMFTYDEWDTKARRYKADWCKVYVQETVVSVVPEVARKYVSDVLTKNRAQVDRLKKSFEEFTSVRRWRNRQPDGPEIDLDAVIDRYATMRSGHSPSTLLYLSPRRHARDFATLVLLDSSLSTDSWVKNRRVMDTLKEAMIVLGEVAADYRDQLAIGALYSNTRNDCRFVEIKKFQEDWRRCLPKLVGLKPTGYTRIGPALRHGVHLLGQSKAKKKLLVLISDGKPTDYDRYEGRYGIEDIRQAVREASAENISIRALAIEAQAKFYLPQMFGQGNYQILPDPGQLAGSLTRIFSCLV